MDEEPQLTVKDLEKEDEVSAESLCRHRVRPRVLAKACTTDKA